MGFTGEIWPIAEHCRDRILGLASRFLQERDGSALLIQKQSNSSQYVEIEVAIRSSSSYINQVKYLRLVALRSDGTARDISETVGYQKVNSQVH